MNCYLCEKAADVAGQRLGIAAAVGICHDCGIGVCFKHSRRDALPGSPLLCAECAERRRLDAAPAGSLPGKEKA